MPYLIRKQMNWSTPRSMSALLGVRATVPVGPPSQVMISPGLNGTGNIKSPPHTSDPKSESSSYFSTKCPKVTFLFQDVIICHPQPIHYVYQLTQLSLMKFNQQFNALS